MVSKKKPSNSSSEVKVLVEIDRLGCANDLLREVLNEISDFIGFDGDEYTDLPTFIRGYVKGLRDRG